MTSDDKLKLLNMSRLPARLTADQVAVLLGFQDHDMPVLVRAGLLKPLGNPTPNAPKYFAVSSVEACYGDAILTPTHATFGNWTIFDSRWFS